ncbi:MAG TPA: MerR family transcriptional regulator [Hyphomicrobiaceae bacterium]|nr:MerR family transcriptional regulator [Hyphomicrobiaceae bacterium]
MSKAADAFRTISEVADDLAVPKHVLRFWEAKFSQIRPMKRGGGRRYYRPEDLELLRGIRHLLHREGYTIKGVQKILREQGSDAVKRYGRVELGEAAPGETREAAAPPAAPVPQPSLGAQLKERAVAPRSGVGRKGSPAAAAAQAPEARQPDVATIVRAAIAGLEECRAILGGPARREPAATSQPARRTKR